MQLELLSSITSTNIQKITFNGSRTFELHTVVSHRADADWARLDDVLCHLADMPGCEHLIEAEFSVSVLPDRWLDPSVYLPGFHEKGRVKVVEDKTGMVVCYSGIGVV